MGTKSKNGNETKNGNKIKKWEQNIKIKNLKYGTKTKSKN